MNAVHSRFPGIELYIIGALSGTFDRFAGRRTTDGVIGLGE